MYELHYFSFEDALGNTAGEGLPVGERIWGRTKARAETSSGTLMGTEGCFWAFKENKEDPTQPHVTKGDGRCRVICGECQTILWDWFALNLALPAVEYLEQLPATDFPVRGKAIELRKQEIWVNDEFQPALGTFYWRLRLQCEIDKLGPSSYCVTITTKSIENTTFEDPDQNCSQFPPY